MKKIQKIANKYFDQLNFSDSEIAQLPDDFKLKAETGEGTELNKRITPKRDEFKADPLFKNIQKDFLNVFLNAFICHYVEKKLSPNSLSSYELAEQVARDNKSVLKTVKPDADLLLPEITEQYNKIISDSYMNYIWNTNDDLKKQLLYTAIQIEMYVNYEVYNTPLIKFLQSKILMWFSLVYCLVPYFIMSMSLLFRAIFLIVTSGGTQAIGMVILDKFKQIHPKWARATNVPYRIVMFGAATAINYWLYKRYFN